MTIVDEDTRSGAQDDQGHAGADAGSPRPTPKRQRFARAIEILAVFILSVATVSSAWSAYEATRWSGVQAENSGRASALRTESTRQSSLANTQTAIDVQLFTAWVTAMSERDTRRADFLRTRFRAEFLPAFKAWLASVPAGEIPPGTPFALPEYRLAATKEADLLVKQAGEHFDVAQSANQTGDNFVLTTVLFATVLFFAGIASHFESVGIKRTMLVLGIIVWMAAVIIMFSLPQNVGF